MILIKTTAHFSFYELAVERHRIAAKNLSRIPQIEFEAARKVGSNFDPRQGPPERSKHHERRGGLAADQRKTRRWDHKICQLFGPFGPQTEGSPKRPRKEAGAKTRVFGYPPKNHEKRPAGGVKKEGGKSGRLGPPKKPSEEGGNRAPPAPREKKGTDRAQLRGIPG